jgi:hypothetical protein
MNFDKPKYPKTQEIREVLTANKQHADGVLVHEKVRVEAGLEPWPVYDSDIFEFNRTFRSCLPHEHQNSYDNQVDRFDLQRYIESSLKGSNRTAVEFGGPGSALFGGFSPGFFIKTVGVTLKDWRKPDESSFDSANNHLVVEGNVITDIKKTLAVLRSKLGVENTDLIISRMEGGLAKESKNPAILDHLIREWYKLLNENGLLFVQIDHNNDSEQIIQPWIKAVTQKYPSIEIQTSGPHTYYKFRLRKGPGAPKELPPAKELLVK